MGAAVRRTPGKACALRFVIAKRMRSPTRARTVGPGTWSPNVHALNFTPGATSMIVWTVSSRISLTGAGSSGFSVAVVDNALPAAKGPEPLVLVTRAGFGFRSILAGSYGSEPFGQRPSHAVRHTTRASHDSGIVDHRRHFVTAIRIPPQPLVQRAYQLSQVGNQGIEEQGLQRDGGERQ